jgi:ABC-type phosphate transport system substrate-binding protein
LRAALLGAALCSVYLAVSTAGPASGETLIVQGSSNFHSYLMVPKQTAIEAASGHSLKFVPSTSRLGLIALLEGRTDLAMISARLEELAHDMREARPDLPFHLLRSFQVSKVRISFVVHPDNSVRSANLARLQQVLSGEIDNWQQLGGPDLSITVVAVARGSVTRTIEAALSKGQPINPRHSIRVEFGSQVIKAVEQDRGALGLAQLVKVRHEHLPELRTNKSVEQEFYLVSLNKPTEAMGAVIAATRSVVFGEEY